MPTDWTEMRKKCQERIYMEVSASSEINNPSYAKFFPSPFKLEPFYAVNDMFEF